MAREHTIPISGCTCMLQTVHPTPPCVLFLFTHSFPLPVRTNGLALSAATGPSTARVILIRQQVKMVTTSQRAAWLSTVVHGSTTNDHRHQRQEQQTDEANSKTETTNNETTATTNGCDNVEPRWLDVSRIASLD